MKKYLSSMAITVLLVMCQVPSALADFTPVSTVNLVWSYANGDGYVFLDEVNCNVGNYNYFRLSQNATKHDQLMSLLLAAFLSAKRVKLGFSTSDNFCRVSSVQLLH